MRSDGSAELKRARRQRQEALLVHGAHRDDPGLAFVLSRLSTRPTTPTPIGIFRQVSRPVPIVEQGRRIAQARAGVGDEQLDAQ